MKGTVAVIAALALAGAAGYAGAGSKDAGTAESQPPGHGGERHMGGGHMGGMISGSPMGGHAGERPLITPALEQREQLGLSADQVTALETANAEFQRVAG